MRSAEGWTCQNSIMGEEHSRGSTLVAGGMCAIFFRVAADKVLILTLLLLQAVITENSRKAMERHKSRMETPGKRKFVREERRTQRG